MQRKHLLVIQTKPQPQEESGLSEQEWSDHYNELLPEVVALDGLISAQRFKLSDHQVATITSPKPGPDEMQYLAIYEVESPEQASAILAAQAQKRGAHGTAASISRYYDAISEYVVDQETEPAS